jgi:hypothetical protein
MNKEDYKRLLREKEERLIELLDQQEHLENEIAEVKQEIGALAILAGEAKDGRYDFLARISSELGLVDAIREVLRSIRDYLTPQDVRDGLERMGYNVGEHSNILASIHTTLRRLAQNNEVQEGSKDGKKAYRLMTPQERLRNRIAMGASPVAKKD